MSTLTLSNPYAVILSAIWGIIKISQGTANTLAHWLSPFFTLKTSQHYEYITDSGAANPLELLHPDEWGCGVTKSLPGYVYLIHAVGTNRYKIGRSINLKTRLQQLQRQSPYPLEIVAAFKTSNPAWDEAYWQDHYKKYRVYGEWFKFDESFYKGIEFGFWSRHEEYRVAELAIALAKSQGFNWEDLENSYPNLEDPRPNKHKYFVEASRYLQVKPYDAVAHLEV